MTKGFFLVLLLLAAFTGCGPQVAEQWKPPYAPRSNGFSSDPYSNGDWWAVRRGDISYYEPPRCDEDKDSDKHCHGR